MAMRLHRPGARIGAYIVTDVLGRGGSGDVYKVVDAKGKVAALKLVDCTTNAAARSRLRREVDALRSIEHPAVPHVLGAETEGAETFVVFDFIEGVSLAHYVKAHGSLKGKKLADLAETLASALAAAHAAGVIHRDVTPSNVMMGTKGPALIDFGLSHRADDPRLTREGLVSGTAGYVAPEVIDGAEPGTAADLWSWAATIAFAMTGRAPFGLGRGALGKTFGGEVALPDVPGAPALAAALSLDPKRRIPPADVVAALRGKTVHLPTPSGQPSRMGAPLGVNLPVTRIFDLGDEPARPQDAEGKERLQLPPLTVRRTGVIAAWGAALVVAATLAPTLAFLSLVVLAAFGRAEHRRVATIAAMRARRGARRGDVALAAAGLPWHFARATAEVLVSAALGAAAGGGVGALGWWLVSSGRVGLGEGVAPQAWGHAAALLLAALVAASVVWRGPLSGGTRDGVRRAAALVARSSTASRVWVTIALVGIGVVLFALVWRTEPWWWPLPILPAEIAP